ncbi:uncharacterized protein (DUF2267 family) [Pontibacter ummariensis]|uniref:Uncharacterized conserved protein, DUF2267 family n=1 Tax=Pontibacter ummariensis TaxID=1610492 RepID=A0A239GNH2_9BACT|nr:DUF2267 domain-containing protein [Pontibacter ummariensis]PRY11343.1 uncharacterized protein (DUF2267 family) [Pontibacter ummariensis]SNS70318.1 Uncharacterized conserved protein, DUF2267 family [Pontibacter ummariensis]
MATYFDKFSQEANEYIKHLAENMGHPGEEEKTLIVVRAVLHALRDRITISESFHVLSQLPMILRGIYVDQWQYREEPLKIENLEAFKEVVKQEQAKYGETEFDWGQHTEDLISMVLTSLGTRYLTEGQLQHIATQMPKDLQPLFPVQAQNR